MVTLQDDEGAATTATKHVVIVGAGMAGLACAHLLLKQTTNVLVTILEASEQAGGRILAASSAAHDDNSSYSLDLGAEFVHGKGTVLTALMDELELYKNDDDWQEIWISSHADGGPSEQPTADGCYGMYYCDGKLRHANDPLVQQLTTALETIFSDKDNRCESVGEALQELLEQSTALQSLAEASFGNTAGCTDLYQLSLPILRHFEEHWENEEEPGDYRLKAGGMQPIVARLVEHLQKKEGYFQLECNWMVERIRQTDDSTVEIVSDNGDVVQADCVVVTLPPPALQTLDLNLSAAKREALQFLGFPRVVKVHCHFAKQLWPAQLQTTTCPSPNFGFTKSMDWRRRKISTLS